MANDSIIPAKRFSFSDNQNIIPAANFYSADFADVLNGQIPGSATALSSLSNLTGVLNTQVPGTNLVSSALNDVSMVGNAISTGISDVTGVLGTAVNDVGQLVDTVANTLCNIAATGITDALDIVNTVVGGATSIVGSVFGDIVGNLPILNSLSSNCLSGLFKGPLGITGPNVGNLCGNLNGACGGGVLPGLISALTCSSNSNLGSNNPLINSLQSNFLTNASQQALSSLGINNVLSSLSTCQNNPFNLQSMNGFSLNLLQQYPSTTQMLDFGNVGGNLAPLLPSIGNMVPNAISNFTNNFTYPTQPFYNSTQSGLTEGTVTADAIQNAFSAINPTWNQSSYDSIPSISSMLGGGSTASDLSNTDTYNAYQQNNSSVFGSGTTQVYGGITNSSNWANLNNSVANNGYTQTYLSMGSGSNNGTGYIKQLSAVSSVLGGGSSGPSMSQYGNPSTTSSVVYGVGTTQTNVNGSLQTNNVISQSNVPPTINNIQNTISNILGNSSQQYTSSQSSSNTVNNSASQYTATPVSQSQVSNVSGLSPAQLTSQVFGNGTTTPSTPASSTPTVQIVNNNSNQIPVSQTATQLFGSSSNGSMASQLGNSSNLITNINNAVKSYGAPSSSSQQVNPSRIPTVLNSSQTAQITNNLF